MVSRKALERQLEPEKVLIGDRAFVNLGSGCWLSLRLRWRLAPIQRAEVVRNGLDEVLLWHEEGAAATNYEQMRLIVMVGL